MKTACTLLLLCLSLAGLAQNYPYNGADTSAVMEYNDDKQWVYYERDGFLVGMAASRMSGDFGTYFRVDLLVQNLTDSAIVFSSENVFAKIITREGGENHGPGARSQVPRLPEKEHPLPAGVH